MRIILKIILRRLAKWALVKHNMELVVVTGWIGVDLLKEGVYTLLDEKFIVRRNTKRVWWDLSVPLNILGFADKRRNTLQWIWLIIKSVLILAFGQKNPSVLVLSAESEKEETAKYWSSFVEPDFLVIVNNKKDSHVTDALINSTKKKGVIIYDISEFERKFKNSFSYGQNEGVKVLYKETKTSIVVSYNNQKITIPKYYMPVFAKNILASLISLAIAKGLKFDDIINGLLKFDLRNSILKKLTESLSKNE